jgi:hypothetical protein
MSNEDLKEMREILEKFEREVVSSPEKSRAFLIKYGFITPDGEMTEHYRLDA